MRSFIEGGAVFPGEHGECGAGETEFGVVEGRGGLPLRGLGTGRVLRIGSIDGGALFAEPGFDGDVGLFHSFEQALH